MTQIQIDFDIKSEVMCTMEESNRTCTLPTFTFFDQEVESKVLISQLMKAFGDVKTFLVKLTTTYTGKLKLLEVTKRLK